MKKRKFDKRHPFINGMSGPSTYVDPSYSYASAAPVKSNSGVMNISDVSLYKKFCEQLKSDLLTVQAVEQTTPTTPGNTGNNPSDSSTVKPVNPSTGCQCDDCKCDDHSIDQHIDEVQSLIDQIRGIDINTYPDGTPVESDKDITL